MALDFKYLYYIDNGICFPYSETVEREHPELIPLTEDELSLLRTIGIGGIFERRKRMAEPTVSVSADIQEEKGEEAEEAAVALSVEKPDAASASDGAERAAKGVTIVGTIEPKEPAPSEDLSVLPTDRIDYTRYGGNRSEIFEVSRLDEVADCDLVRFAKEALGRDMDDVDTSLSEQVVEKAYRDLRRKVKKWLERDVARKENSRKFQDTFGR